MSQVSHDGINYLLNEYRAGRDFVVDYTVFESRYPSSLRDENNPERALEFCYENDASNHGLPNFSNVLGAFFDYVEDDDFEGYIIKNIFDNRGIAVPSEIPNSWYGANFNFVDHASGGCVRIEFDNDNDGYLPNWFLDKDNDGYHANGVAPEKRTTSPGTGWVQGVSAGEDCDDNTSRVTKPIRWYFNEDDYGFHTETQLACGSPGEGWTKYSQGFDECPTESGEFILSGCVVRYWRIDNDKDYYFVPGSLRIQYEKPDDGNHWIYEASGEDCDDDDPDIKSDCAESIPWYYDNDGDGYHGWFEKYISTPKEDKFSKTTEGKDCDDNDENKDTDCSSSCKKRTGYLHDANFAGKTVTVGDNVTIKRDNFRNDSWGIISKTNCETGKVPIGSTVKVTSTTSITRPGTSLKYFKVEYDECSTTNKTKLDCSDDGCETTKEDLKKVFPNTNDDRLEKVKDAINKYAKDFGIDTKEELQHFLAQAGHESKKIGGHEFEAFEEDARYKWRNLGTSSKNNYFNPISDPDADPEKADPNDYKKNATSIYVDAEKFFNLIYDDAKRGSGYKLGNTSIGDGYKYRGRGIFQLTGKANYEDFNTFYQNEFDKTKNLITNPNLVATDINIATISALWFFRNKVLNNIDIDQNTTVKKITKKVNGGDTGLDHREGLYKKAKTNIDCN